MSFDIGSDTVQQRIATIVQNKNDTLHNSAEKVSNLYDKMFQSKNIEKGKRIYYLFLYSFSFLPFSGDRYMQFDIGSDTVL